MSADLRGYGARRWQVELTAVPISKALMRVLEKGDEQLPRPSRTQASAD